MANQIITCPPLLFRSLIAALDAQRQQEVRRLRFDLLGGMHGFDAVCVHAIDPRLALSTRAPAESRVFVLLLTCAQNPAPSYQPLPLPDDLVVEMLDRLMQTLPDLPDLEGHERLALAALLLEAQVAPNRAPLRHAPRAPENDYEARLLASAIELEAHRTSRLGILDAELAAFRGRALYSGLAATIRSLSAEAPVVNALNLQSSGTNRFRLCGGRTAQRRLEACRRRAATDRLTLGSARAASATHEFAAMPSTSRSVYLMIARGIGVERNWRADTGIWRTRAPRRERGLTPPIPTDALFTAMRLFDEAFDWHLLAHAHPLVRAALVAVETARLQPLAWSNRRFIDLMTTAAIEGGTAAPLPFLLALHRRRREFQAALSMAVEQGRLDLLLDTLIGLASDAIMIGDRIIDAVAPVFSAVTVALLANGVDNIEAAAGARAVFGTVLLEHDDLTEPPERARAARLALRAARDQGLMDVVAIGETGLWSASAVRRALSEA
jgi:hypothetical protein